MNVRASLAVFCSVLGLLCSAGPSLGDSDDCATATPVGDGQFPYDTTSATDDGPSPCASVGSKNVWFLYTAPATANVTVSTCASTFGPNDQQSVVAVYSGTCAAPVHIVCSFTGCGLGSSATFAATGGESYLVQIGGGCDDCRSTGIVSIVSDAAAPANDLCTTPTPIGDGVYPMSNIGATTDGVASCADSMADVWYLYTPGESGTAQIETCGSDFNTVLTIYDGPTCTSPELACSDDDCRTQSFLTTPVVGGQPYLIRVAGAPPPARGPAQGIGQLRVRVLHPPANDECANALPVGEGAFAYTNVDARTDGPDDCDGLVNDVWFVYTPAATGLATFRAAGFDTTMSVYQDACDGQQLGCNQDLPSVEAMLRIGVTAGVTYYIRVGGDPAGSGVLTVSFEASPANDHCENAAEVPLGSTPFTTRGADTDGPFLTCSLSSDHIAHDVWFSHTAAAAGDLTISTCGSLFDTLLAVYADACPDGGGAEIACDDNSCGDDGPSLVTIRNVAAGQRFIIRVGSFDGVVGDGVLNVALTPACAVGPEPDSLIEPEACGESVNGGCADFDGGFTDLSCAPMQTVYGTAFAGQGLRDTDWYRVTLANEGVIHWGGRAEFPAVFSIRSGVCQGDEVARAVVRTPCEPEAAAAIRVPAGTYYLVVVPTDFYSGASCDGPSHYLARLSVNCDPIGACCRAGTCSLRTQAECDASHGTYRGDGSACENVTYQATPAASAFEPIDATGLPGPQCDSCEVSVPLGFTFNFYGRPYSSVFINANGFLSFGPVGTANYPHPIPRNWSPNNVIAPYWTDLWTFFDGSITYQTLGNAPERRFIAQWTGVPRFFDTTFSTFQVVLFESDDSIEFRYLDVQPSPFLEETTIGVEDANGVRATSIDPTGDLSNTSVRFVASVGPVGCPTCRADFNGSGGLSVQDIFDFLNGWFAGDAAADFNGTNGLEVQDIFDFLSAWFAGC
ncbi:MAG TPA: GC-type dockerin domain-anchored protein [Phycisphaerales bacterium]|nr:GC-type dockerin domain-anchored protein [Phycisphaerales bacterium]